MDHIRYQEGKPGGAAAGLVQHLAEEFLTSVRLEQYRCKTFCRGIQLGEQRRKPDGIPVGEEGGTVEADDLLALAEDGGQVIPGERSDVYFASSIK